MGHTYSSYSYSAPASAAVAAYNILLESKYFDSVSLNDATNTVTCKKGSETPLFTVAYSNDRMGRMDWSFGVHTSYATEVVTFLIALCDSAVYIGFNGYGGNCYTLVLYKSTNDLLMFTYRNGNASDTYVVCEDTTGSVTASRPTIVSNTMYSTACPICSINGSVDPVSTSKNVYRFVERYSGISTTSPTFVQIGDSTYLTDGFVCMKTT